MMSTKSVRRQRRYTGFVRYGKTSPIKPDKPTMMMQNDVVAVKQSFADLQHQWQKDTRPESREAIIREFIAISSELTGKRSTPEAFGEIHLKYTTPYLLLKLLPVLSNTLMRENLSFSYLGSRFHTNYTEIGYSISEFLLLGEVGVYAGFDDLKYKSIGAKIILRFN